MMNFRKKNDLFESGKVTYIKVCAIVPNPFQPRRIFDQARLQELSESICQFGVLQPLTVRRRRGGFELVAGERRLRAAKLAGLSDVPCIVLEVDEQQSSLIALVENLQRHDLDFFEEAEGLQRLIKVFGLSQEEASKRVGKSQSSVANKLRLLRHPPELIDFIRKSGLTERHARALLRITDENQRVQAAQHIVHFSMNVQQSDEYIDKLLCPTYFPIEPEPEPEQVSVELAAASILPSTGKSHKSNLRSQKTMFVVKDVRLFLNTINHAIDVMKSSGFNARCDKVVGESDIVLTIHIPKNA